jgi:hypothetical protein
VRIGIDFDNTIANYRDAFTIVARKIGLIEDDLVGDKTVVRDFLRSRPGGEQEWQRLQGQVYGNFIGLASPMPGLKDFLETCREHSADVFIVSHKTEFGHFDPSWINLRDAAREWLRNNNFFGPSGHGITPANVTFEATRDAKILKIEALSLDHFIDDLVEIFDDGNFPQGTQAHLLCAANENGHDTSNWPQIQACIFGS